MKKLNFGNKVSDFQLPHHRWFWDNHVTVLVNFHLRYVGFHNEVPLNMVHPSISQIPRI